MRIARLVAWLLLLTPAPLLALPCAGFNDVDTSSPFCAAVEWIRNRGVTTGCTSATEYCPDGTVTRLQMAAFMNRLGSALEPRFRHRAQTNLANSVNAGLVVCQTTSLTVTGYPRVATANATFSFRGTEQILLEATVVASLDEGQTWQPIGAFAATSNPGNHWLSLSPLAEPQLYNPGTSVMFGVHASTLYNVGDAVCQIAVRLDSRTGVGSPFDDR